MSVKSDLTCNKLQVPVGEFSFSVISFEIYVLISCGFAGSHEALLHTEYT